jgi:hypothetical protein
MQHFMRAIPNSGYRFLSDGLQAVDSVEHQLVLATRLDFRDNAQAA